MFASIARDAEGIAAYIEYEEADADGIALICYVARANRLANTGVGVVVIERAVREIARSRDARVVMANIHTKNLPSQRAFRAAGFTWVGTSGDIETWVREIAPAGQDEDDPALVPARRWGTDE